jgi:hypothetical protein
VQAAASSGGSRTAPRSADMHEALSNRRAARTGIAVAVEQPACTRTRPTESPGRRRCRARRDARTEPASRVATTRPARGRPSPPAAGRARALLGTAVPPANRERIQR